MPGLTFSHFFHTTVVIADIWYAVFNFFTVHLQNHTECTMRRRVVRTQVQEHEVFVSCAAFHTPVFRNETKMFLFVVLLRLVLTVRRIFSRTCRIFFTKWMTFPVSWQQDTTKHWMPFEVDAKHIVGFTFVPVGIWPDVGCSRDIEIALTQCNFNTDVRITL